MGERGKASMGGKALSHSLVFLTGFALGKWVDYGELATYREIHESPLGKWRRRAGNVAIGAFGLGTIAFLIRTTTRAGTSSKSP